MALSAINLLSDVTSNTKIIAIDSVSDIENIGSGSGTASAANYPLVNATLVDENGGLGCTVQNNTITTIVVNSSDKTIYIHLPAETTDNTARDFVIRLEVTATTAPQVQFVPANLEEIDYEANDDTWATIEPGVNIISFTETKR